jgi:hypothetical protein
MWHPWGRKGDIHGFGGKLDERRPLGRWSTEGRIII